MTFVHGTRIPVARDADDKRRISEGTRHVVAALADTVLLPDAVDDTDRLDGSRVLFLSGDHGGLRVSRPDTLIQCQPGARFTRQIVVDSSCRFVGAHFRSFDGSNNEPLLVDVVATDAYVFFDYCTFEKENQQTTAFVRIADGAKVAFTGCKFMPLMTAAGTTVNNPGGVLPNVYITNCVKLTGVGAPHFGVTVISELT